MYLVSVRVLSIGNCLEVALARSFNYLQDINLSRLDCEGM